MGTGAPSDLKEDALNERSPLDATTVPPEEPLPTFPAPAPLPPLSTAAEARRRQDPEAIWELLAREHGSDPPMLEVKLLRASWLLGPTQSARRFEHSGRDLLPRRQWLEAREPDAYISLKELRALHDLHDKGRAGGDTDEANAAPRLLPIVAVAMAWLAADHPDPDGETIDLIAALLAEKRRTRGRHTAGTLLGGKTAPAASTAAASAASASAAAVGQPERAAAAAAARAAARAAELADELARAAQQRAATAASNSSSSSSTNGSSMSRSWRPRGLQLQSSAWADRSYAHASACRSSAAYRSAAASSRAASSSCCRCCRCARCRPRARTRTGRRRTRTS
jgi:hypothetical protein